MRCSFRAINAARRQQQQQQQQQYEGLMLVGRAFNKELGRRFQSKFVRNNGEIFVE
jgi:hypothetical protein